MMAQVFLTIFFVINFKEDVTPLYLWFLRPDTLVEGTLLPRFHTVRRLPCLFNGKLKAFYIVRMKCTCQHYSRVTACVIQHILWRETTEHQVKCLGSFIAMYGHFVCISQHRGIAVPRCQFFAYIAPEHR